MAELVANSPCAGVLPVTAGGVALSEVAAGHITALAPFRGKAEALSTALKAAHGMEFPAAGRATGKAGARCVWTGRGRAFLMGPAPDAGLAAHAAVTDQSDAWAVVALVGTGAEAVLARLVPVDLRASVFKRGHTARTLCGHMNVSITRVGPESFQIMAFRSMARTLAHELGHAMELVAARAAAR